MKLKDWHRYLWSIFRHIWSLLQWTAFRRPLSSRTVDAWLEENVRWHSGPLSILATFSDVDPLREHVTSVLCWEFSVRPISIAMPGIENAIEQKWRIPWSSTFTSASAPSSHSQASISVNFSVMALCSLAVEAFLYLESCSSLSRRS